MLIMSLGAPGASVLMLPTRAVTVGGGLAGGGFDLIIS